VNRRAQRQPNPLQWVIPALTGTVLVVNAAWASSSAAQFTGGLLGPRPTTTSRA
jgi:hypothetical protein